MSEPLLLTEVRDVLSRLERLSADSLWARRASGLRGALLKLITEFEKQELEETRDKLKLLMQKADKLLILAAKEIPDIEALLKKTNLA